MTPKLAAGLKSTYQTKAGNRILELDGLRAVAVMLVMVHHMLTISETLPAGPHQAYKKLFSYLGLLGVDVFFTISGFIITKLLLREWLRDSNVSLKAFYIRRAFRILPPFIAYLSVIATLAVHGAVLVKRSAFVVGALFLSNIRDITEKQNEGWFVAHTWSLSVEEQFYIFFPPLICLVTRFNRRTTLIFLVIIFSLSLLSDSLQHSNLIVLGYGGLSHFRYICVGVAYALSEPHIVLLLENSSRKTGFVLWLSILGLRALKEHSSQAVVYSLIGCAEPLLLIGGIIWFLRNPLLCSPLRWPVVQWLGACSYSIYLWQQLFTGRSNYYSTNGRLWILSSSPILALLAIVLCAGVSRYLVELPCIGLGKALIDRFKLGSKSRMPA